MSPAAAAELMKRAGKSTPVLPGLNDQSSNSINVSNNDNNNNNNNNYNMQQHQLNEHNITMHNENIHPQNPAAQKFGADIVTSVYMNDNDATSMAGTMGGGPLFGKTTIQQAIGDISYFCFLPFFAFFVFFFAFVFVNIYLYLF